MKGKFKFINAAILILILWALQSCKKGQPQTDKVQGSPAWYTCPMPEDSVYSKHQGSCPKCGMKLVPMKQVYSCPMHPEHVAAKPDTCPACGMDMVVQMPKASVDTLASLVQPTNHFVVSRLKAIAPSAHKGVRRVMLEGFLTYDPNSATTLSAKVAGRIEKLYVKYNFQYIKKGQKLLDLYSEELLTAQNEWLYLLQSGETLLAQSVHDRLLNLGMDTRSLQSVRALGKALAYVPVYANASGHAHFLNGELDISNHAFGLTSTSEPSTYQGMQNQEVQMLREGNYVKKGDALFAIADEKALWALFKVKPSDIAFVKLGQKVEVHVNGASHAGQVDFIEKTFEDFYTLRVYLRGEGHTSLQIGTLAKGYIVRAASNEEGLWIPAAAALDLGQSKYAVFVKTALGYKARALYGLSRSGEWLQVSGGLSENDSIAPVASYLVDSEAFIVTDN